MPEKILVVDDERDMLDLLTVNLKRTGYEVIVARNGFEALVLARRHLPDLVLLDLVMEGPDGFTVCETLHRQPATSRLPVIILTAADGQIARMRAVHAGACNFINKPFKVAELLRCVAEALLCRPAPGQAG
jgi:DNA-binding response OmpR family regulator